METTVFIFNEDGFIKKDNLIEFKNKFVNESILDWKEKTIEEQATIFFFLMSKNLELTLYNHGYVLKLEGSIIKAIIALTEIDKIVHNEVTYYISPFQRIENNDDFKYPRGGNMKQISEFLDFIFKTDDYTHAYLNIQSPKS